MSNAAILVQALRDLEGVKSLDAIGWNTLVTIARAEQLLGTLACKLDGMELPGEIGAAMADGRLNVEYQHRTALWEANCARRALAGYNGKVVLMKGTAYVAAGLQAGTGRHIGDLDIMVAEEHLDDVERLLFEQGGWEWVKEDAYDDAYYRDHMHELPPMIHKERDRMIDVHHTILPKTAKPSPDAKSMLEGAVRQPDGLYIFSPADMICHCAAHLIADGDLTGGLRNLWDMHQLLGEFDGDDFWPELKARAEHHQLWASVQRAARLAHNLFGTDIPAAWQRKSLFDRWFIRRLLARDEWGRGKYPFTRLVFYIRSHWLRMPPLMLARHLWTKWRKG